VHPLEYPTQAADFIRRNRIRGNTAVPFDWGEYFIWKLYPKVRVSIDGRFTTAYPSEVIHDDWEWMEGGHGCRDSWLSSKKSNFFPLSLHRSIPQVDSQNVRAKVRSLMPRGLLSFATIIFTFAFFIFTCIYLLMLGSRLLLLDEIVD